MVGDHFLPHVFATPPAQCTHRDMNTGERSTNRLQQKWIGLRTPGRLVAGFDERHGPTRTFIGGLRVPLWGANILGGWNVTAPFARLSLFDGGLRISGSTRVLSFLLPVPTWEARYEELTEVAAVGKIEGITSGVLFRTADRRRWVVFWTFNRKDVLSALLARGLPVVTTPRRFRYLRPYR